MAEVFACPVCGGCTYVAQADEDISHDSEMNSEHTELHVFGLEKRENGKDLMRMRSANARDRRLI
jgi:hypothetical protein